jgi:hypothetical protein
MWPVIGISEKRRQRHHLTEPWLSSSFALVTRKRTGSPIWPARL